MAQRLDLARFPTTLPRAASRHARRLATTIAAVALLLSLPVAASATYPGSVDGRLAIGSSVDGNFDIYTVLPNGEGLLRLTTDPLFDACPAWSADGKHIAWCHGVQRGGIIDVWTMKLDGSSKHQVTDLGGRSLFPDFAPDGSRILFSSIRAGATDFDLFVVNVDGTGLVQLTSDPGFDGNPAWSPDGGQIVFTSDRTGVGQVYVMDANGGNVTQLTFDDVFKDQVPDWSPDGSKIAYAAGDPGDILVMNANGSNQHTIVGGSTDDFGSAWSPDGGQIAFVRFDDRTVRVANADGSGVHAVRPFGLQAVPGWQPRGNRQP
jgi:Tol biopolymer transport system component